MDTKRLMTMMLLSFAIIFGWQLIVVKMYEAHPEWKKPGQQATTAPTPATVGTTATTTANAVASTTPAAPTTGAVASTQPTAAPPPALQNAALHVVAAATQPAIVTLGEDDEKSPFRMKVDLSSTGASLDSVTLNKIPGAERKGHYVFQRPMTFKDAYGADFETRALATRSINVNGADLPLAGVNWNLEKSDRKSAVFALDLGIVRVRKIYELTDEKSPGQGYELIVRHEVENTTQQPQKVKVEFTGTLTPPRESERGPDLQILSGYDDGYQRIAISHDYVDSYTTKAPDRDLTSNSDKQPFMWAGTASVYFDAIVKPEPLDPASPQPKYVGSVKAYALNPAAEAWERQATFTISTAEQTVEPGKPLALTASTFMGPRWRKLLNEPYYAAFPRDFDETLVLTSGPCGVCTFHWLINGLVALLGFFHFILRDWGLAIICLVVLVRLILHPITKRSQVSMMRMGKMGPEIERLKEKYKDDKDELNRQMMQLYKDQGIGAYLGCLPMFLQMPIWIALWSSLQSTFELRQAPFLYGAFGHWMSDLARPDHLIEWAPVHFTLPLFGAVQVSGLNILPILMGIVMFMQQKYTPQPPSTTPEQEMQKKMMLWMSTLLFPLFLYNGPSGLNLYIMTSTTIGIIEAKRIRAHIKQKEEEEKAGKIIIDAPKGMQRRRDEEGGSGARKKEPPKPPKAGFAGWLEQLQKKAEDLQRDADRQRGK